MRILVTGAQGQLGRALRERMPPIHEVLWTDLDDLDVRDLAAVRALVGGLRPEAVIHLAALTQVDLCESRREAAFEVNALGSRYMAAAAREVNAEMLFVSTDYVFDGGARRPYLEYDDPRPLNTYGRSKLHGERAVAALTPRHYIVRTSGLFGPGGPNFVESILAAAAAGEPPRVVADQICRPTYAGDLAAALLRIVGSGVHGIFHVASAGETSWFDFARAVLGAAGQDPGRVRPMPHAELRRPAARPLYSVLDTRAYELTFGQVIPGWRAGLDRYLADERSR